MNSTKHAGKITSFALGLALLPLATFGQSNYTTPYTFTTFAGNNGYGSGDWPKVDALHAVLKSYSIVGAFAGARTPEETRAHHAELVALAEAGKIRVPLDKVFDFAHTPQAIDRLAKGEMVGKVVVTI